MLRGNEQGDTVFESLDFGRALVQNDVNGQPENMENLWSPGTGEQESPASIISHKLQTWRKNNVKAPAAKAAEELDNLYASLPEMAAVDLTFQDMIDRNNSVLPSSPGKRDNEAEDTTVMAVSPRKSHGGTERYRKENGHSVGNYGLKGADCNSLSYAFPSKLHVANATALPKASEVYQPSRAIPVPSEPPSLDNLGERSSHGRYLKTNQVMQEGSYSPFSTPNGSFRKGPDFASPKMSPTDPVSEYMLQVGGNSFGSGREPVNPAKYLELQLEEKRSRMSSFHDIPPRPSLNFLPQSEPRPPVHGTVGPQHVNDCSACSATNLSFKTNCLVLTRPPLPSHMHLGNACGKTFCLTCMNSKTKDVPDGRQCKKDCTNVGSRDKSRLDTKGRKTKYSWRDCWPSYGCFRVKDMK